MTSSMHSSTTLPSENSHASRCAVQLLSATDRPLETLYVLWHASREQGWRYTPAQVAEARETDMRVDQEVKKLALQLLDAGVPVIENISFTFLLRNVPISLREQMVRHRVGVKVGDRLGTDLIPDLGSSTWWSQSMRVLDMGTFCDIGAYYTPPSIMAGNVSVQDRYLAAMEFSQACYNALTDAGVPAEDARNVLPLGCSHDISWTLNLASIRHILSKRSCWILQLGVWEPIITGMIAELVKLDPLFGRLADPPCIDRQTNDFQGCVVRLDNEKRLQGEDPLPPCALYLKEHAPEAAMATNVRKEQPTREGTWSYDPDAGFNPPTIKAANAYRAMRTKYAAFWNRVL